jgi:uncharacterized protein (DUF1501 family)
MGNKSNAMKNRRQFLQMSAAGGLLQLPFGKFAFANTDNEARFVFILLRGAMDGLAAVSPYADPNYAKLRGTLEIAAPGTADGSFELDGFFGLHPAFQNLHSMYQDKQLLVAHAVAGSYRERSHFDGQKQLENGTNAPLGADDGWLNRALGKLPTASAENDNYAIALAQTVPLILQGGHAVNSWAPAVLPEADTSTIDRIAELYDQDEFFSAQFASAMATRAMADDMSQGSMGRQGRRSQAMEPLIKASAKFLTDSNGPRIAVFESSGWDTHRAQGRANGLLANNFRSLDDNIGLLKTQLGDVWDNTVVAVVSEFGRTVAVNGSGGTDHGTAGVAMIAGGAVNGGKVLADWPGLGKSELYEGRDLAPTTDMRSIFKTVLHDHLHVSKQSLEDDVFPSSKDAGLIPDLLV